MGEREGALEARTVNPLFIAVVLGISVILAIFILQYGNMHADRRLAVSGIIVNVAWQMHLGYRPYHDFLTSIPPLFIMGCKYAFDLWGVRWNSLTILTLIFAEITYLSHVAILYKMRIGNWWSIFLPFTVQSLTLLLFPRWWFNQITSVIGCLFISASLLLYKKPKENFSQLVFLFIAAFLLLTKPNVMIPLVLFTFLVFISIPGFRLLIVKLLVSAALLATLLLLSAKINPFEVFSSYISASAPASFRLLKHLFYFFPFVNHSWEQIFILFIFFVPCLFGLGIILDYVFKAGKSAIPYFVLALGGVISGFVSILTNHEIFLNGIAIILFSFVIPILLLRPYMPVGRDRMLVSYFLMLSLFLFTADGLISMRRRLELKPSLVRLDYPLFFKGTYATPRLTRILKQVDDVIKKEGYAGQSNASVFFGWNLDFAYAVYGIHPAMRMPLWWEPQFNTKEMILRFEKERFKTAVFFRGEYTYFPKELKDYLNKEYVVSDYGELTVHELRQQSD
ncbi:MAG: hypothetical protein ABSB18_00975 [Candidatus Omnitrophota bacterium]